MTAIHIAIALLSGAIGTLIGAVIGGGGRAEQDQQNSRLRWHISKIIQEAQTGQITEKTLQNAHQALTDEQ